MRFIYKILVGLIIFNSMLVMFGMFFKIGDTMPLGETDAQNITGDAEIETGATYAERFTLTNILFNWDTGSVTILTIGIGLTTLFGWALKSPVPIGAGLFSTFIALLYYKSAAIITTFAEASGDDTSIYIITGMITLIGIIIAILAAFTITEMFAGQTGAD